MSASTTAPTAGKDEVKPGLLRQIAESNGLMGLLAIVSALIVGSVFGFQTAVRADAPRVADAMEFLNAAKETLAPLLPESVSQFGAAPMLMVRLAERERAQIFLESPSRQDLHRAVSLWVQVLQQNRDGKIRWSVDMDAQEA